MASGFVSISGRQKPEKVCLVIIRKIFSLKNVFRNLIYLFFVFHFDKFYYTAKLCNMLTGHPVFAKRHVRLTSEQNHFVDITVFASKKYFYNILTNTILILLFLFQAMS